MHFADIFFQSSFVIYLNGFQPKSTYFEENIRDPESSDSIAFKWFNQISKGAANSVWHNGLHKWI